MIEFLKKHSTTLIIGATGSIIAIAAIAMLKYESGQQLEIVERNLLWIIAVCSIVVLIAAFIEKLIKSNYLSRVETKLGITEIFDNFELCEQEVLMEIESSNEVRAFLQMGKSMLSGTTNFYDYLLTKEFGERKSIKILHADINNPYLSSKAAERRESYYADWKLELEYAIQKIERLGDISEGRIEGRQHMEGYYWRLFIFDNVAYAQPYLYEKKNSDKAPVIKCSRIFSGNDSKNLINRNSLYHVFSKYFENKWNESLPPDEQKLTSIIPKNQKIVVAALMKYAQYYVFAIPHRYLEKGKKEIPFHCIGGKLQDGEDMLSGLIREIKEETGLNVVLESAAYTRYIISDAQLGLMPISDRPKPFCVYKRTRTNDKNFADPETLWLVGYESSIDKDEVSLSQLKPNLEVAVIVVMTGDVLINTLLSNMTYNDIINAKDGSRVIIGNKTDFDYNAIAHPSGVATIFAQELVTRIGKRL